MITETKRNTTYHTEFEGIKLDFTLEEDINHVSGAFNKTTENGDEPIGSIIITTDTKSIHGYGATSIEDFKKMLNLTTSVTDFILEQA